MVVPLHVFSSTWTCRHVLHIVCNVYVHCTIHVRVHVHHVLLQWTIRNSPLLFCVQSNIRKSNAITDCVRAFTLLAVWLPFMHCTNAHFLGLKKSPRRARSPLITQVVDHTFNNVKLKALVRTQRHRSDDWRDVMKLMSRCSIYKYVDFVWS